MKRITGREFNLNGNRENNMAELIALNNICKIYNPGENEVRALDGVSLVIDENEFVAIIGQSGDRKSVV